MECGLPSLLLLTLTGALRDQRGDGKLGSQLPPLSFVTPTGPCWPLGPHLLLVPSRSHDPPPHSLIRSARPFTLPGLFPHGPPSLEHPACLLLVLFPWASPSPHPIIAASVPLQVTSSHSYTLNGFSPPKSQGQKALIRFVVGLLTALSPAPVLWAWPWQGLIYKAGRLCSI